MTSRREFLQASFAVAAVSMAVPFQASAQVSPAFPGVIYSKDNPGQWAKKVGSHAPVVTISARTVTVQTKHPMSAEHFIVRHTLVLADGRVLGAKTFTGQSKSAESTYELPAAYRGKLFATSFCNKHDFWLTKSAI